MDLRYNEACGSYLHDGTSVFMVGITPPHVSLSIINFGSLKLFYSSYLEWFDMF